jgi:hypothetical protein
MLFVFCFWSVILLIAIDQGSIILNFYRPTESWQRKGGSVKILPMSLTPTLVVKDFTDPLSDDNSQPCFYHPFEIAEIVISQTAKLIEQKK